MEAGPILTFSSPSHMHRREFDYGLHHDGGYLFSRVGFLLNYFALISATAAGVLDGSVQPMPRLCHLSWKCSYGNGL